MFQTLIIDFEKRTAKLKKNTNFALCPSTGSQLYRIIGDHVSVMGSILG